MGKIIGRSVFSHIASTISFSEGIPVELRFLQEWLASQSSLLQAGQSTCLRY